MKADELFRPGYHFTPMHGWMNDPNGMVFYEGEWHLFYQHNPKGTVTVWSNMSWGHAVSKDMIVWEHLPVALIPDDLGAIFSGSAVVDELNSTGFQANPQSKTLLAYYTSHSDDGEKQSLAVSTDKGRSWLKYRGNPILPSTAERPDFRDPHVFFHTPTARWIMVCAVGQVAEIYSSANGITWTLESAFGEGMGSHAGVWECPDLFEIAVEEEEGDRNRKGNIAVKKWILLISLTNEVNKVQYFVGEFDGHVFTCDYAAGESHWLDYGRDFYAAVTWNNAPNRRRVLLGWMSNWDYASSVPTLRFRSAQSVPREVRLVRQDGRGGDGAGSRSRSRNERGSGSGSGSGSCTGGGEGEVGGFALRTYPVAELEAYRGVAKSYSNVRVPAGVGADAGVGAGARAGGDAGADAVTAGFVVETLVDMNEGMMDMEVEVTVGTGTGVVSFRLVNGRGEYVEWWIDCGEGRLHVDRANSGIVDFGKNFLVGHDELWMAVGQKEQYCLRVLVDRASLEIFEGSGANALTIILFPNEYYNRLEVRAGGGAVVLDSLKIHPLIIPHSDAAKEEEKEGSTAKE